jgi:membrane-bound lytic murein transglycosylase D
MSFPINRVLILGVLLLTGPLATPGPVEAESPRESGMPGEDRPRADAVVASLGESPERFTLELGLVLPLVKHEGEAVGSEAVPSEEPTYRPEIHLGLVQEPVLPILPLLPTASVLAAMERPEVRFFLDRFQTGYRRAVVERWLSRSGRYAEMIRDVLVKKGLPEELIFTAMIESGFDPTAASRAGARGLWQFMAATARRYGLRVDRWLDERLDPEKSTLAAAAYLRDLYGMFGSWNLVQAAYNAGEMRVVRAIQGMGTSDFWQLTRGQHLAEETKNFVPAIQAAALIAREPDRYGFTVTLEDPLRYDIVRVPAATSLTKLALSSGVPDRELLRLNPELRLAQTPPGEAYALKVPVGTVQQVSAALHRGVAAGPVVVARKPLAALAKTRAPRGGSRTVHIVRPRETVGSIAKRYGMSPTELARLNQLGESDRIRPGDRLRVAALATGEGQGGFR